MKRLYYVNYFLKSILRHDIRDIFLVV